MATSTNPSVGGATSLPWGLAETSTKVMMNGDVLFNVVGLIRIEELISVCVTANNGTASTLQYSSTPTVGSVKTISGATATLASATAGTNIRLAPTDLTTAPTIVTASNGGAQLGTNVSNRIVVKEGTITAVVGVGSTTGTWKHYLYYTPLSASASVLGV